MDWFCGDIAEAVRIVKQQKKCLLVFIKGYDEVSSFVGEQFDDQTAVACKDIVCLQLEASSQAAKQFSVVYALLTVPCVYLIGPTGQVIDVKVGRIENQDLVDWICEKSDLSSLVPRSSKPNLMNEDSDYTKYNKSKMETPIENLCSQLPTTSSSQNENATTPVSLTSQHDFSTPVTSGTPPLGERVEYARQLLDANRKQKEEEEKTRTLTAEVKRREMGKGLNEFKERQRQHEIEEALTERRKEEAEARKLRERLRQQIEEDRLIKKERWDRLYSPPRGQTKSVPFNCGSTIKNNSVDTTANTTTSDHARLQLKLLNTASLVCRFPSTATLAGDLRNWIEDLVNNRLDETTTMQLTDTARQSLFQLVTHGYRFRQLIPAKLFEPEEENQTMLELGLCPSASLILVPLKSERSSIVQSSSGIFSLLVNGISSGLHGAFGVVGWMVGSIYSVGRGLIVGLLRTNAPNAAVPSARIQSPQTSRSKEPRGTHTVRRQGNMARLSHMPDNSDDEQARWNGNSTEQL